MQHRLKWQQTWQPECTFSRCVTHYNSYKERRRQYAADKSAPRNAELADRFCLYPMPASAPPFCCSFSSCKILISYSLSKIPQGCRIQPPKPSDDCDGSNASTTIIFAPVNCTHQLRRQESSIPFFLLTIFCAPLLTVHLFERTTTRRKVLTHA